MVAEPYDAWEETKRRLRLRWPGLNEEDLDATGGDRTALLGLLEGRLGYAPGNAEGDLDEVLLGETVVPRDVADEDTHTGTSGPVPGSSESTRAGQTAMGAAPVRPAAERAGFDTAARLGAYGGAAGAPHERPRYSSTFGDPLSAPGGAEREPPAYSRYGFDAGSADVAHEGRWRGLALLAVLAPVVGATAVTLLVRSRSRRKGALAAVPDAVERLPRMSPKVAASLGAVASVLAGVVAGWCARARLGR